MKLRCVTNSIRLRIRKSELERLKTDREIHESLNFPTGSQLLISLQVRRQTDYDAQFDGHNLIVILPENEALAWCENQQVSLTTSIAGPEHELHILVEKDFPCKDREDEDKTDLFGELEDHSPKVC